MILFAQYLLVGVAVAFLLELFLRWTDSNVNAQELFALIFFWPVMVVVFIYHFIKGLFEG